MLGEKCIIGLFRCITSKSTNVRCTVIPFMHLYYTDNVPVSPTYRVHHAISFLLQSLLSSTFKAFLCVPAEHDCTVPNMCKRLTKSMCMT